MVYMKTCCCCFDTKNGSIASGVLVMVLDIIAVISYIIVLAQPKILKEQTVSFGLDPDQVGVTRGVLIFYLVLSIIFVFFSGLLIHGVRNDRSGFLLPWVVAMSVRVALSCISLIVIIITAAISTHVNVALTICIVFLVAFVIAFMIYMILCVESQRKLIAQNFSNPPTYAAKM